MNKKQKIVLACVISLVLLLIVSTIPVAADSVKKASEVGKVVFIHYPQGNASAGRPSNDNKALYSYSGYHWSDPTVNYWLDSNVTDRAFIKGIQEAFDQWHLYSSKYSAHDSGTATSSPGVLDAIWDGTNWIGRQNVVGFNDVGTSAIGITHLWYNKWTKEIIEVDTALNSNPYFEFWQNSSDNTWDANKMSDAYDVDVQNIMTHEAGHWLILNDLYNKTAVEQTMYGRSGQFDLAKRTLASGDIAGIQAIYGQ